MGIGSVEPRCDFYGRAKFDLSPGQEGGSVLEIDADGPLACADCRSMRSAEARTSSDTALPAELATFVGQAAGATCRTLEIPNETRYAMVLAATKLIGYDNDRDVSPWTFFNLWPDETTLWRELDGCGMAHVGPDGSVWIDRSGWGGNIPAGSHVSSPEKRRVP
jgi:hypothetical protein